MSDFVLPEIRDEHTLYLFNGTREPFPRRHDPEPKGIRHYNANSNGRVIQCLGIDRIELRKHEHYGNECDPCDGQNSDDIRKCS